MKLEQLEPYYKTRVGRIRIASKISNEVIGTDVGHVNGKLCSIIRQLNADGMEMMEIYDFLDTYRVNEIKKHIEYDCEHSNPGDINYSQCGWIKFKYNKGLDIDELANEYDVDSPEVIELHLANKCGHNTGLEPVDL